MLLARGEKAGSGVEHRAGLVQGICGTPAPIVELLPGASVALIKGFPGEVAMWKGPVTVLAPGSSSAAALLKPVNPSIVMISVRLRQISGWVASGGLKTSLERPVTMSRSREGPLRSPMGVKL